MKRSGGALKDNRVWAPAGLGTRGFACLLDLLIIFTPLGMLTSIGPLRFLEGWFPGLPLIVLGVYSVVLLAQTGQTLGMRAVGLRVIHPDRVAPGLGYRTALLRLMGFIPSALLVFGVLTIIWDRDKRAWHDKMVGTYVISERESWTPSLIMRELTGRFESLQASLHALKNTITLLPLDDSEQARHEALLACFEPANVEATNNHLSDAVADLRALRRRRPVYRRALREAPGALARKYLDTLAALLSVPVRLQQYGEWFQRTAAVMRTNPIATPRPPAPAAPQTGTEAVLKEEIVGVVGELREGLHGLAMKQTLRETAQGVQERAARLRQAAGARGEHLRALRDELRKHRAVMHAARTARPAAKRDTTLEDIFTALRNFRALLTSDERTGMLDLVTAALEGSSLRVVLQNAIREVEGHAKSSGVSVELAPGISPMIHVPGDPGALQRAISSLLDNSIEAIRRRTNRPSEYGGQVRVGVHEDRQAVLVELQDNGCGFSAQGLDAARRGERQSSKGPSGGLGLGSTRRTLEQYPGGALDLFSDGPDQGATVTVRFEKAR